MARVSKWLTAAILTSLTATSALIAQEKAPNPAVDSPDPVLAGHPNITASLERITRGSALWRTEVEALRHRGRPALVVTPEQVVLADPHSGKPKVFDRSVLAEIAIVPDSASGIAAVVVVVNLPLLDAMHGRRGSLPIEKYADLDRILIHEVYGHAFPYLRAGDESGRCSDPATGQRPQDSCAIRRENAVRAELGLGRRTDYGLLSLTIGRPSLGDYGLTRFQQ